MSAANSAQDANDTDIDNRRFSSLGIIATSAPAEALLAALAELRPEFEVRLRRLSDAAGIETLYRVEIPAEEMLDADDATIDPWLRIKSALLAAFPAGKAGAVKAIDS